jgi:hypothetical protein
MRPALVRAALLAVAALSLQGCVVGTAISTTGKVAGATVGAAGDVAHGVGHAVTGGGKRQDQAR